MPLKNLIKNLAVPSFQVSLPPGGPNTTCCRWVSETDLGPSWSFPAILCTAHLSRHFSWLSLSGKSDLTLLCSSKTHCHYSTSVPSHVLSTALALSTHLRRNSLTAVIKCINTAVYSKARVPLEHCSQHIAFPLHLKMPPLDLEIRSTNGSP